MEILRVQAGKIALWCKIVSELKCCKRCGAFATCDHKGECCVECEFFDPVDILCMAGPEKKKPKIEKEEVEEEVEEEIDPATFLFEDDDDDDDLSDLPPERDADDDDDDDEESFDFDDDDDDW
ncbi:hypothetical protein EU528_05775 [Candidatus Thorarchaeota archaeon]|nr:MAG: hypothetical protein EU528_05775 [Candidatus Thorarchaeota archaeon]